MFTAPVNTSCGGCRIVRGCGIMVAAEQQVVRLVSSMFLQEYRNQNSLIATSPFV
jgi:hypothetical protein